MSSRRHLIELISVPVTADVEAALRAIDRGGLHTALLVDERGAFAGLVTDGDIRRALLDRHGLDSSILDVPRPQATVGREGQGPEVLAQLLSEAVRVLPILDDGGKVVDVAVLDGPAHLPVASPSLSGNELRYVRDCILTGWISSAGPYVTKFEQVFADFCGTRHAIATSNGTAALHLALECIDVGLGDEVIVPTLTFVATANAVRYTGATPVFVDCENDTWNIDPRLVEAAIGPRTKAIVPVHLYGLPADMDAIADIARSHDLMLVEDAAQAHGADFKGRRVGAIGHMGTFSFYGNKTITTGEGGMVVTDCDELAEKARLLRDHGMAKDRRYWHPVVGYNYRLTNMQAAIGVAQMERVGDILAHKRANAAAYRELLGGTSGLRFQLETANAASSNWLFSLLVEDDFGATRDQVIARLAMDGIESRPLFLPIHDMPPYKSNGGQHPVASYISSCGLSLPSGPEIGPAEVERICRLLLSCGNSN